MVGTGAIESFIYISETNSDLSQKKLGILVNSSEIQNGFHGITGFLYYHRPYFVQYFEGTTFNVQQLKLNIQNDSRHHIGIWLNDREKRERRFPNWFMKSLEDVLNPNDNANDTIAVIFATLLLTMQNITENKTPLNGEIQRFVFEKIDYLANIFSVSNSQGGISKHVSLI